MTTTDTANFDILTAITQDTINYQLAQLQEQHYIPDTFSAVMADTGISIKAKLAPPTISLAVPGSLSTVIFSLPMPSGTFTYYDGFGTQAVLKSLDFENWCYAFLVDLNFEEIAHADVQNSTKVPDVVKQSLSSFDESMFTIKNLFLDFTNADLAHYDPTRTTLPGTDGTTITQNTLRQLQGAVENYFTSLAGTDNPYILGYAATAKDKDTTQQGEPPLFNATGATFSTFQGADTPGGNTLNFLISTNGNALPAVPPNGALTASPISSPDYDGAMIVSPGVFKDGYIVDQVLSAVSRASGLGPFVPTDAGWHATAPWDNLGGDGKGAVIGTDEKTLGILNIYMEQRYDRYADATVITGPTPSINVAGYFSIENSYYEYPFNAKTWDATATTTMTWSVVIALGAGADGTITVTPTVQKTAPTPKTSENVAQKFLDLINAGMSGFLDQVDEWAKDLEEVSFANLETTLNDALGALNSRVILPGGDVFFFSGAAIQDDNGARFDIQYKAQH